MPMSSSFKDRLFPRVEEIAQHYGTPFHIYDEAGILDTGKALKKATNYKMLVLEVLAPILNQISLANFIITKKTGLI